MRTPDSYNYHIESSSCFEKCSIRLYTASLALHPALPLHFDHVIVEESSRCNVAMGVACFTRGRAITFLGDGKQLDAFTAINKYLPIADAIHWRQYASKTILDLCRDAFVPVVPIVEQHRMNNSFARMTNDLFSGLMVGHRNDSPHDDSSFLLPNRQMVLVIDTFDYVPNPQSEYHEFVRQQFYPRVETSPYNFTETKAVANLLSEGMLRGWKPQSVVILANYHEQNRLHSLLFQEHPLVKSVTTVGKFQAYQADVVILALASSSPCTGTTPQSTSSIVVFMLLTHLKSTAFQFGLALVSLCDLGTLVMPCLVKTTMSPKKFALIRATRGPSSIQRPKCECLGIRSLLHRNPINYFQCACPFHRI